MCNNDARDVVSGDASAWAPSPSPQGGASNDNTWKVASDDVLSQDDAQDETCDGHEGGGASHNEARHVAFRCSITTHEQTVSGRGEGGEYIV